MKNKKLKLKIIEMHCVACAMSIDGDLEDLNGVKSSSTSYAKQECEVHYDSDKIGDQDIIKQIKKTGYSAKLS